MKIEKTIIDSEVFERNILEGKDFSCEIDFDAFERTYIQEYNPLMAVWKIPAEEIGHVHFLESKGFRFIEFQIKMAGKVAKHYSVSQYPFTYEIVESQEDLEKVLKIASSIFIHDRIYMDPMLDKRYSGERYKKYVLKSFYSTEEFLYKLQDKITKEIVGFGTHRDIGNQEVLLLIGGVKQEYKKTGLGAINDYLGLQELSRKKIKKFYTHVSGLNYPIMNLEIAHLGWKVLQSYVVLRKYYG